MEKSTLTEDKAEKTPAGGVLVGKKEGQTIIHNKGSLSGYLVGRTHAEGGIKAVNKSTGQPLEVQGGEVVITAPAVSDQTKREFEGKMMTNREILSTINEKGGGVAFAKGGDIPKDIKRTGASYKYGGKTMTDHEIYKYITGGHLAEGYSLREIASIHQVPLSELKEQVRMGMKAESEHTSSKKEQMQIVKDHLFENPKYYTLLKKAGLNHGGKVRRGSLVTDAKKGNTPARDLNNYNDVLDLDADGMVGAETSLYADGGLIAPNGKTSNLTPEQYKLVRTPEFKEWFGDWENDPENASKVVDDNGEPLVVYHGTYVENPFYIFDFDKADLGFHFGTYEQAKNRSETKLFFKGRKSIVNSFFLNIKTIFESTDIGEWEYPQRYIDMFVSDGLISESDAKKNGFYRLVQREENKQIREYLLNKYGKFGGFVYNNKYEGKGNSFIVLNPNQIKLADGTNTKFDTMNPDIRYADGGDVKPYDANMEGDSADMMFAEGGAVSPVVDNWNEVPSIWKNTSKVKKVAFTNSPYDKGLYSIVAPFLGNDDLRPIMSGINFDENGITVTDAHKLISLPYPSKEFEGIYEADLSKRVNPEQITISGKYPNYAPIIPESKNTVKYEVDVYKLLQYTNVALKYANKTTFAVNYKIYDEVMGFNGKFLIEALTTLLKLGHDKVYGHFVGYTKAFVFSPNKNYELGNDDLILIMPVMVTGEKYLGAEDMLYGNNRKLSVYYDFNNNEIHNADGSIAEFKMTYASNSVINPDDVNLLQKLANGRNKLPILDYVKVEDGVARASDLDSEYYLKGVDLPNGIYKTNKGALEITMEAMDDYPRNPIFVSDEDTLEFTINSDVFEYYVDKFQNVVGKDELRPVMQGICLHHTSDNKLFLAGTDANILLKVNITEYVDMPEVFKDMKFIIQPKRLYDFLNSTEHTTLRIKCNLVATTIESDSWSFYARNIDGNFPNYEAVIPREATKLVSVGIEPIKKAFNSEPIKTYIKETDKKLDIIIFNKEDEIFIAKSEGRYSANPFEVKDVEKLCETNVNFTLEDYYNDNKNVLLIMPYGYDKQTNFAFRKDLVDRVFKVVNSNKLDLHYTEMNRAYLIPIDTFDFKATTKEHKVREQKPSAEEIKLVSTINEINEIKEVIESLEILLENANRKDKKEIKETIEGLQILLDTYEY
jgi:DNA polymerase III sliding clamp (beta) subunit (PCNA family)